MNNLRAVLRTVLSVALTISVFVSLLLTFLFVTPGVVESGYENFPCPSMQHMSNGSQKLLDRFYAAKDSYMGPEDIYGETSDPVETSKALSNHIDQVPETLKKIENDKFLSQDNQFREAYCRTASDSSVSYYSQSTVIVSWAITLLLSVLWFIMRLWMKRSNQNVDIRSRYIMETTTVLLFVIIFAVSISDIFSSYDANTEKSCHVTDINIESTEISQKDSLIYDVMASSTWMSPEWVFEKSKVGSNELSQEQIDEVSRIFKDTGPKIKKLSAEYMKTGKYSRGLSASTGPGFDCQSYARQSAIIFASAVVAFGIRWIFVAGTFLRKRKEIKRPLEVDIK